MDSNEALQIISEVKDTVDTVKAILVKAQGEITTKIGELEGMLGSQLTPEIQAKITELRDAAQGLTPVATSLDDIVPDQP